MKGMKIVVPVILIVIVVILIFAFTGDDSKEQTSGSSFGIGTTSDLSGAEGIASIEDEIRVLEDGTKYIIHPSKILSGGPPKDGIPSIDNPKFVSVEEASDWIDDEQLVLAISHKGVDRAYPMQILVFHEIVNDVIAGDRIAITFCPLCGSGIAYEGKVVVQGEVIETEFGTSGKLFNSNLVMYDRQTDSYWTQIGGKAIVGELTGQELNLIDLDTVKWGEWKKEHGDAEVLSRDTGHIRNYGDDDGPYNGYYESDYLIFNTEQSDDRIFAKDVVFGIEIGGVFKAYREEDIIERGIIEDTVNGIPLIIEMNSDGTIDITDADTGEVIPKERDFWFAWYAFHPETEVYGFD